MRKTDLTDIMNRKQERIRERDIRRELRLAYLVQLLKGREVEN